MGEEYLEADAGTGSVFDAFERVTRDYQRCLVVSPGDLLRLRWPPERRVEILFLDLVKSWDLNRWVLRHWFPALIPGRSVVVQQDYLHYHEYWVALTMEWLADCFERVEEVAAATVVFRLVRPIPPERLATDLATLPTLQQRALLERAMDRASPSAREILRCALARCLAQNGDRRRARSVLEAVRLDVAGADPAADFAPYARSNRDLVEVGLTRSTEPASYSAYMRAVFGMPG